MSICIICDGTGSLPDADHPCGDCGGSGEPPCITDWLCLPGAHLRFGECVDAEPAAVDGPGCDRRLGGTWDDFCIDVECEREPGHPGPHSASGGAWEWE